MSDKEQLELAGRGKRLEETTHTSGWRDVQDILDKMWMEGLAEMREGKQNGLAKMSVVEALLNEIRVKVNFGEIARKALLDQNK